MIGLCISGITIELFTVSGRVLYRYYDRVMVTVRSSSKILRGQVILTVQKMHQLPDHSGYTMLEEQLCKKKFLNINI